MADYGDLGVYITDLTDNVSTDPDFNVSGSGIFDNLMETVNQHIQAQYEAGRILGTEYSNVYINALQTVLDVSYRILLDQKLREKQAEETAARTALLEEQKLTESKQGLLLDQQTLTEIQNTRLVDSKADESEYRVSTILPNENTKITEEIDLLQSQDAEVIASTLRQDNESTANINLLNSRSGLVDKQALTEASNKLLVDSKTGLTDQQTLTEVQNTRLIDSKANASEYNVLNLLPLEKTKLTEEIDLLQSQDLTEGANKLLIDSKTALTDQQALTEAVNTDKLTYELNHIVPRDYLLLKAQEATEKEKQNLISMQKKGFYHDANQKYLKSLIDAWSIWFSVAPDSASSITNIVPDIESLITETNTRLDSMYNNIPADETPTADPV